MLKSQELTIKLSEKRQKINDLLGKEDRSEAEINELDDLTKSMNGLEVEYRAALTAESAALDDAQDLFGDDGEVAELRHLKQRVGVQDYIIAAVERRGAKGAGLELNAALDIPENRFPIMLLADPEPEIRATTDTDTSGRPRPWLDRLFADTAAAYLGISFTSVPAGAANFPITTAGGSSAQRGRTQDADTAAWTVGVTSLEPSGNSIHLEYAKEDDLRIPGLQAALRRDMQMALVEGIDKSIFLGDSGANENQADIAGLNTASNVTEKTLTQANKVKPAETLQAFNSLIDGVHASDLADLNIVASEGSYKLWTGQILEKAGETASIFKTLAQFLNDSRVMWMVRELESATTNNKFGAFISRGRGLTGAAVAPVWMGAELIVDRYTKAKSRECLLTLSYFWNFGLPRPANFARLKFVT